MKANTLLSATPTAAERAKSFIPRIKKSIQKKKLDVIQTEIDDIDSAIEDLGVFALEVDINKNQHGMTKEDCEDRFTTIMDLEYEKEILTLKLKQFQATFDGFFAEEVVDTAAPRSEN